VAFCHVGAFALTLGCFGPPPRVASATDQTVHEIIGGPFEASGVAQVGNTSQVLFVDDGRNRDVFLMELSDEGVQRGTPIAIPLLADVTDLEAIATDGRYFYVVGSQSKLTGTEGDGLVRFEYDPVERRIHNVSRIRGLKSWLAEQVDELRDTKGKLGDHVLNIEGLAWDAVGERLLLGLRAPVINDEALLVPIAMTKRDGAFTRENLRPDGAAIRLKLDGAGIRSLEYDAQSGTLLLITGASLNDETRDFRVLEWNGNLTSTPREIRRFDRSLKPEGWSILTVAGRRQHVLVFDTNRWALID
jgi:hypothetical protein